MYKYLHIKRIGKRLLNVILSEDYLSIEYDHYIIMFVCSNEWVWWLYFYGKHNRRCKRGVNTSQLSIKGEKMKIIAVTVR